MTPLKVKIIIALELSDTVVRDADIIAVRFCPELRGPYRRISIDIQGPAHRVPPLCREPVPAPQRAARHALRPRHPPPSRYVAMERIQATRRRGREGCWSSHVKWMRVILQIPCVSVNAILSGLRPRRRRLHPTPPGASGPTSVILHRSLCLLQTEINDAFLLTQLTKGCDSWDRYGAHISFFFQYAMYNTAAQFHLLGETEHGLHISVRPFQCLLRHNTHDQVRVCGSNISNSRPRTLHDIRRQYEHRRT